MRKKQFILVVSVATALVLSCECSAQKRELNECGEEKSETRADSIEAAQAISTENEYDGDPKISGSTANIRPIVQSIAKGDAKRLASLTNYPIERKYPLRNINNATEMIERFDQIFDKNFRDRMKSSRASDWHSYGWRGYCLGDDMALWVYDSLYIIDYYSAQEQALYEQLAKKEMASLHKSLQSGEWHPYCCYKDFSDGSIIRVDIKERTTLKKEYFHKDTIALMYPQLHAFKIRGDEEFRLSVYPPGYSLSEKPYMVLKGYADIGGSANMIQYMFSKGDVEIEFGDCSFENGKLFMTIKKNGEEAQHEIEVCYWLDFMR